MKMDYIVSRIEAGW